MGDSHRQIYERSYTQKHMLNDFFFVKEVQNQEELVQGHDEFLSSGDFWEKLTGRDKREACRCGDV